MAPESIAPNTEKAFEFLLDLLGWDFDRSGDKADQMTEEVAALGVVFDLSSTKAGAITVANSEKRKFDVSAEIADSLKAGCI